MYTSIKKTIISQDEQIMQILTSLFKNQKVANSNLDIDLIAKLKENILIYGPTGTGKTEIIKRIAKIYNVPLVIEDATSLSEVGYVGRNITDMLKNLLAAANNVKEDAEKGILVIDEFDKLAEKRTNEQDHVSRIGVQRSLLKLLDGSKMYFDGIQFDTSRLTIICVGAFIDIIKDEDYQNLTNDNFINYGIMREIMGRISKRIAMNALSKEDIKRILVDSDFSPLKTYEQFFALLEIEYDYNNDFVEWIAEKAVLLKTGARDLKIIVDNEISSALFKIFAGEYASISLVKPETEDNAPYILRKKKHD